MLFPEFTGVKWKTLVFILHFTGMRKTRLPKVINSLFITWQFSQVVDTRSSRLYTSILPKASYFIHNIMVHNFCTFEKCTTFDLPKRKDAPRGNILQPIVDFPKIYYRWLQDTHYLRDQLSKKHPRLEPVTGSPSADFSFQPSLF